MRRAAVAVEGTVAAATAAAVLPTYWQDQRSHLTAVTNTSEQQFKQRSPAPHMRRYRHGMPRIMRMAKLYSCSRWMST